jgi:hypothetical protein
VSDTPKIPALAENDPRRWIAAIVGGVVLGEALWSLLQLLIRDWAMPALVNALGQGPTQNQNAFLPQPLFVAFIEACLAGIFLVLLMAWSGRGRRKVRVIVESRAARTVPAAAAPAPVPAATSYAPPTPAPVLAASVSAPATPVVVAAVPPTSSAMHPAPVVSAAGVELPVEPARPVVTSQEATAETAEWKVAAEKPVPIAAPTTVTTQAPPKPAPAPVPPKSKKPKTVYYNIVGEPIESDE